MGEYEPNDSRNVTLKPQRAPGEPPRTGPREGETRQQEQQLTELEQDERDDEAEATGSGSMGAADAEAEAALRERAIEQDADELDAAAREDRND
jgi:hypothetical protein